MAGREEGDAAELIPPSNQGADARGEQDAADAAFDALRRADVRGDLVLAERYAEQEATDVRELCRDDDPESGPEAFRFAREDDQEPKEEGDVQNAEEGRKAEDPLVVLERTSQQRQQDGDPGERNPGSGRW